MATQSITRHSADPVLQHIGAQRKKLNQLAAVARAANLTFENAEGPDIGHVLDLIENMVDDLTNSLDEEVLKRMAAGPEVCS
jgi:hypothetical protein